MLCRSADLIAEAHASGFGIAAFNVITLEHVQAVAEAARRTGRPVIVQISQNAVRHHGGDVMPLAAATTATARSGDTRLALHLDHVEDIALLHRTAECGASSVMFDASRLPDEENIAATREAARWAHGQGLFVEAELGEIGGKGSAHTPGVRTDPADAARFVAETGVDALAVAVGSSHAMVSRTAALDLQLIARISDEVPVPLVLHGSSGVPHTALRAAVKHGMTKVNIGTLLNVSFTRAVRTTLAQDPEVVDPRRYLGPARDAMTDAVSDCLMALSTSDSP
ncbi:class II fructose-bisphosphate aldolase family protein [Streptomyces sp. NBC_01261]|uniref:class II fructose-bisphosphate aldolase n=1 Tax=Streptomyces sp. NBC_01261 TaxID=2903802 RepID=UPI002E2F89D6|nr:class II fructose-bisphosphate aldolase [Streptomyces sp. NBC_01261]